MWKINLIGEAKYIDRKIIFTIKGFYDVVGLHDDYKKIDGVTILLDKVLSDSRVEHIHIKQIELDKLPEIGDKIQFNGKIFTVEDIIINEDNTYSVIVWKKNIELTGSNQIIKEDFTADLKLAIKKEILDYKKKTNKIAFFIKHKIFRI